MKFISAIMLAFAMIGNCYCQVSAVKETEYKFYELADGVIYDTEGSKILKAKGLDKVEKGNIPIEVKNRENYSNPVGIGIVNGGLIFKNATLLNKELHQWVLFGNNGETYTIQITYVKDGLPYSEYSKPYTIVVEPGPDPGPIPVPDSAFDGLADKISNMIGKVSVRDRTEIVKYYQFLVDGINKKTIVTVDQLKVAVATYKLQLEDVNTSKEVFTFITADGSKRQLTIPQVALFYAEVIKGFQQAPQPNPVPVDPAPIPEPGLRVMIVYETGEQLTREQLITLNSVDFVEWLNQVTVKVDGQPEYRVFDPNDTPSGLWGRAMQIPRASLPWLIVSNGESGFSGPLPANLSETQSLIQRYVK